MFTRLLIANRGEIACRIIKTAHQLGIHTIAIYSTADRDSLHVRRANEAWCVGNADASESYLNAEAIFAAATASRAEAIHPGYGFLSEQPDFAAACHAHGFVFVGPSAEAMQCMASKQHAKQRLEKTTVPLIPGYHENDQTEITLLQQAERIGVPLLIKAALGGGGKGMRIVRKLDEFIVALAQVRREARALCADETVILEQLLENSRHIEIQIMADHYGQVVHLFERDCSVQRRHQKLIEEAPAPNLPNALRESLRNAAITVAKTIEYRGAGTVEFLVTNTHDFYFMEMNTRIQVEHPITEQITGLDLIEWQLRIAANQPLPITQEQIHCTGHAIECRLCAEDSTRQFIPSAGKIHYLREPCVTGIRIDSGVTEGDWIVPHYDSLFAKLIAWGETRAEALQRMQHALTEYILLGVHTNIPFLQTMLSEPDFQRACLNTSFVADTNTTVTTTDVLPTALLFAASSDYLHEMPSDEPILYATWGWQPHLTRHWIRHYCIEKQHYTLTIYPISMHSLRIDAEHTTWTLHVATEQAQLRIDDGVQSQQAHVIRHANALWIHTSSGSTKVNYSNPWALISAVNPLASEPTLTAPMPASVTAVLKRPGDSVSAGEGIIVLEAMKMEHTVCASMDGQLISIDCAVGLQVNEGAVLAQLLPKH